MLNVLWVSMMMVGIIFSIISGTISEMTDAMLNAAKDAIDLSITMTGVMAFWMGIMEVAAEAGVIKKLCKMMEPMVGFLFPNLPKDHEAVEPITVNMIANILGLGWAATPAGLKAMEKLTLLQEKGREHIASNEMCTFLIINISSLQLVPITIIAYRSQYGSANPAMVVGPGIVATIFSTVVGVIFCRLMDRKRRV